MTDAVDWIREEWRSNPFCWGTRYECFLGVCDFVERAVGRDPGFFWRGRYHDEDAARSLMRVETVLDALSDGFESIEIDQYSGPLMRGCVVVCDVAEEQICGIFDGAFFMFKTPGGLRYARNVEVLRVWKCV